MSAKTDVVVKLVLVFLISLLSFSIGTYVGKKYSDNQHKLAALEPGHGGAKASGHDDEQGAREVASADAGHGAAAEGGHGTTAAANGDTMSDEEIAKLAEEFVSDETTATTTGDHGAASTAAAGVGHGATAAAKAEHGTAAPAATSAKAKSAPAHDDEATTHAKTRSLEKSEPLAAAKKIVQARIAEDNRNPSSIPKDVTQYNAGKFTVQVGSYAKEEEAQKVAGDLKSKGYSAYYIPAAVKGQTWYRVSVGLFSTPREAQAYRAELMAKSKITSAIVQKIVQ